MIAVMTGNSGRIGVDIEIIHPRIEVLSIKFLNEEVKKYVDGSTRIEKLNVIWGAKEVLYLKKRLNVMLAKHTGQSIEVIERDSDRDRFMGAEEAVKYGLIDRVLTNRTEPVAVAA